MKTAAIRLLFFFIIAEQAFAGSLPVYPKSEKPVQKIFEGEKLVYGIHYMGIRIGTATATVSDVGPPEVPEVYRITIEVESAPWIDLIYKVRDIHHTEIDRKTLYSVRYEKNVSEGPRKAKSAVAFDQKAHKVVYQKDGSGTGETDDIPPGTQDEISCGYWFRTLEIQSGTSVYIPVHSDHQNWDLEVRIGETSEMEIDGIGRFTAVEVEPVMDFEGIFFRRGKIKGWISLDERRIPLEMKVSIPVLGKVRARLAEYYPGKN